MNGRFFKCNCGAEGIYVEHDTDWGTEIALFERSPHSRGLKDRLRFAWACLKGKPYADQIMLDDEGLADLVDHLINIQNKKDEH